MEAGEPHSLAEVRALAGHLEMKPLFGGVVVRGALRETDGMLLVICFDQVLENGARFPDGDSGVGVFDGGNATVDVDGFERRLLHVRELEELGLVRKIEFVEEHHHLPRVGASGMVVEDDGFEGAHDVELLESREVDR